MNATISNTSGASITFIPYSVDKSKLTRVPYPIYEQIPKISKEFVDSNPVRVFSVNGNSSGCQMFGNEVYIMSANGNISGVNIWNNLIYSDNSYNNRFFYVNSSNTDCLYYVTDNTSIVLANGVYFNGLTYIDSHKLFRVDNLIINGTLVLNDSRVIMKSNLKKDWTKEKAEQDAISFIYKEQIDKIFNYSKLTGIGYYEIDKLVADYKEKQTTGYYEANGPAESRDVDAILKKADKYGIPHEVVTVQLLYNNQKEPWYDRALRYVGNLLTVRELAVILGIISWSKRKGIHQRFIGIIGWIKRKIIRQK